MGEYHHEVASIVAQVRDPQLIEAVLLIFAKLVMTAAMALLISTFSTSFIFTVITTIMLYLIGHLESIARGVWLQRGAETGMLQGGFLGFISLLVPDMNSFTIIGRGFWPATGCRGGTRSTCSATPGVTSSSCWR